LELFDAVFSYMVIIFIQNETISRSNFFSPVTGFTPLFYVFPVKKNNVLTDRIPPEFLSRITGSAVYDYSLNDKTSFPVRGRNYSGLQPWECSPMGKDTYYQYQGLV
jgi:hypothetical protein